jgi:hypothetical protein
MVGTMKERAAFALLAFVLAACANAATPPASPAVPETLEIRCDGETTEALTETVQARSDGVHIVIRNTSDLRLLTQWDSGGEGADPGETTVVLPILPGTSRFRCLEMTDDLDPGIEGGWARFDVVAPEGWVSPLLDCPAGAYSGVADFVPGARGVADPVADAREQFRLEGVVTEAGYRTEGERTFINVTPDGAKESFTYTGDEQGGWLRSGSSGCSD